MASLSPTGKRWPYFQIKWRETRSGTLLPPGDGSKTSTNTSSSSTLSITLLVASLNAGQKRASLPTPTSNPLLGTSSGGKGLCGPDLVPQGSQYDRTCKAPPGVAHWASVPSSPQLFGLYTSHSAVRLLSLNPPLFGFFANTSALACLIRAMLNHHGDPEIVEELQRFLFVNSETGKWDTPHQSSLLRRIFAEFKLPPLTVSQWRHAAVSISAAHLGTSQSSLHNLDLEQDDDSNFLDLQRNHSTLLSNTHYGDSSGIGITRTDEAKFQKASEDWQELWKVYYPFPHPRPSLTSNTDHMLAWLFSDPLRHQCHSQHPCVSRNCESR